MRHPTLPLLLAIAVLLPTGPAAAESQPCKALLAEGFLEMRRVRYERALELFEQAALGGGECAVEARLGIADNYNRMNEHKLAAAAAQEVLRATADREILAEAQYQIGLAFDKRGGKMNKKKVASVEAFLHALELSDGGHEKAARSLLRIYRETHQDEAYAALQARYPRIRVFTLGEQREQMVKSTCDTVSGKWDLEIPRFDADGETESAGFTAPVPTETPQPKYPEREREERRQGLVVFEAGVGPTGKVLQVRIIRGLNAALDGAALDAVCRWVFQPATNPEGTPVASYTLGEIELRAR